MTSRTNDNILMMKIMIEGYKNNWNQTATAAVVCRQIFYKVRSWSLLKGIICTFSKDSVPLRANELIEK